MPDVPMKSPITPFLYVLMRDHLPTGTVKYLIDQAQRAGDPAYSAPELEQLAERYAAELLDAPPRETSADLEPEPKSSELPDQKNGSSDKPRRPRSGDAGRASDDTIDAFLGFLREHGGRCKPNDLDSLGKSSATRARVLRELRSASKIHIEFEGKQRLIVLTPEGCTCKWAPLEGFKPDVREPDQDCPAHPSPEDEAKHISEHDPEHTSEPDHEDAEEGLTPDDPASHTEEDDHDGASPAPAAAGDAAREHRGSADDGGESGAAAGSADQEFRGDAELRATIAEFIDNADGDVWPRELETAFSLSSMKRLSIIADLKEEGRVVLLAPGSPQVRYRSAKRAGARPSRRPNSGEAAEPIGSGTAHLRDASGQRAREAVAQREAEGKAAEEALPKVREWARGSGTFGARQVRDTFDLERGACARVLGTLGQEGAIRRVGDLRAETYEAVPVANGNGNGNGRAGKRPLHAGADGSTLEGRALAAMHGEGLTLKGVMGRLGVSEEVARSLLGRMFRGGDVRPRSRGGEVFYIATV